MPKVSIIIPFNNVEDYIEQCLDSVLTQSLKDIEIILVNDASVDKSREIVQGYADKDSRIKIIDVKEQKGQGFARNRAIEVATGEYIGFVDSDDFVEQEMFEELYKKAKADDTDITMCQVREYDDVNEYYITSDYYSLEPLISFGETVFSAEETKEQILDINVALWNKIYKREYLNRIEEKFPEGYIYEDLPFFFGTYLSAKRVNIVWKNLYSYRVNRKNSTMQQVNDKVLDRLPMVSLTYEKLKSTYYLSNLKQKIQGWIINDLFHRYTLLNESYHKEYFFLMKKVFENLEIENVDDDYWKRVYHFEGYLLVINNSFEKFNQAVFNEYLDIHKVEDRLQSQIISIEELDRRFGLVYDDLSKVYKYSENIVETAKNQLTTTLNVDEKISNVYEEISKTYGYTNEVKDGLNEKIDISVSNINTDINNHIEEKSIQITAQTDEKISKVYEEITKNYECTNDLNSQVNEKISNVYSEMSKTYEYTNEVKDVLNEKIDTSVSNINADINNHIEEKSIQITAQTDEKISKVYEEITKNYEYTNGIRDNLNEKVDISILTLSSEVNNSIEKQSNKITNETDEKVSKVYDEITKNYEYTNQLRDDSKLELKEKSKDLYSDIKDLSFVVQDNFVELNKEQDRVSEVCRQLSDKTNQHKFETDEKFATFNSQIENIHSSIDSLRDKNIKNLSEFKKDIEIEKVRTNDIIAKLKSEFMEILREEQTKHKAEVLELKSQIRELEYTLREEMKSPLKKLIEKYQSKQEK